MTKNITSKSRARRVVNKLNPRMATVLVLVSLLALALFMVTSRSARVSAGDNQQRTDLVEGRDAVAGQVLVKFRHNATSQNVADVEQAADADSNNGVGDGSIRLLHSRSKSAFTLARELSLRSDVEYAEPNYIFHTTLTPNDSRFGELWGLQNTGQPILGVTGTPGADIKATLAWDVSTGSRANVVAVIDTGIDYNHPDLAANVWSAPTAFTVNIGGTIINCAAGTHGFNAINNTCNPLDDNDHGSHTSGTIGAVGNNIVGVAGVNWTASVMGSKFLDASGSGSTVGAINAIEFTIQAKAAFSATAGANVRVLSNSWGGGGFSQALLDEINKANTNNMLFVAAAGNNGTNNDTTAFFPANYNAPNVVAVAATDNNDALASFSNFGRTTVHLGGPGVDVLSTTRNNTYSYFSGTSMATPHVSGAAALVLSRCTLDTAGLKANLLNNVDPISSMATTTITGGRLNVNKALRACSAPATPDYSLSATPASQTVAPGAGTSYTVTVTPSGGFTGTVSFSVGGLPSGATASFNPASVNTSGSSTMSVTTSTTTPTGSYPLTITGSSGALTRTTSVTLVVANASADFSLSATPSSRTVLRGSSTTYTVTVTPSGGFNGTVSFNVSGLPSGASASFSPPTVTASGSTTMTVTTSNTRGTFPLTITGTSGTLQRTTSVSLTVTK